MPPARESVGSRPGRGWLWRLAHKWRPSFHTCFSLRAWFLCGPHFAPPGYVSIRPAPERAPATHRDCLRRANQCESQPAIERPERHADLRGGVLRAVRLFHRAFLPLGVPRAIEALASHFEIGRAHV